MHSDTPQPLRMLFHTGFHKTGTTSVQRMLVRNRRRIERSFRIFTRPDMIAACEAARAYSVSRAPADLLEFASELASVFETVDVNDPRPVIFSSEDLSGHMPGRRGLTSYAAAPNLMATIADTATLAFPAPPELTFYYSTRAAGPWLKSCYAQHVRAVRMKLDFSDYADSHAESADLDSTVEKVRQAVAPNKVVATPLEAAKDRPLGPLALLFDAIDAPASARRGINPLPPVNVSMPQDLLEAMLEINRSDLPKAELSKAKSEARRIWEGGKP